MRFCPFAHRVHLVLNAKQIPYHIVYLNQFEVPEWYFQMNPSGTIPGLQLNNEPQHPIITESMSIAEYLDKEYPNNKLYPIDRVARDETELWIKRFDSFIETFDHLVYHFHSKQENDNLVQVLYTEMAEFEAELIRRKTQYFGGQTPGILDYAIWPWIERFGILRSIVADKYHFDNRFPYLVNNEQTEQMIRIEQYLLLGYSQAMWSLLIRGEDSAVKKHLISTVSHTKFAKSLREGKPHYDLLIDEA